MRKKFNTPDIKDYPSFVIKNPHCELDTNKNIQLNKFEKLIGEAGRCMNTCDETIYVRLVALYYYL